VAVVGHVEWVDFIPLLRLPTSGEVMHAGSGFTRAGGGGAVAAAVLAELGAQVDFFTSLGRDHDGEEALALLRERGIEVHVAWRAQPTRRAVTLLEEGGERTIITLGERLEPHGADELEWDRLGEADGVYFTAGDTAALGRARGARVLVASPRARHALAIGDPEGAPAIDALVFSAHDGDESEWAHSVGDRARLLVATDGANGGRWWGASEGRWSAAPPPGPVRDSYGCGDSFAAAFTYGLAAGMDVAESAALGARMGALCLTRDGAP
jgi:ribokinase